jgi:hypothetical protein
MLCLSYYCLCLLFNKIGKKDRKKIGKKDRFCLEVRGMGERGRG